MEESRTDDRRTAQGLGCIAETYRLPLWGRFELRLFCQEKAILDQIRDEAAIFFDHEDLIKPLDRSTAPFSSTTDQRWDRAHILTRARRYHAYYANQLSLSHCVSGTNSANDPEASLQHGLRSGTRRRDNKTC